MFFSPQAIGDHLGVLSPVAAAAVTPLQLQLLTTTQEKDLVRVRDLVFTRQLGKTHMDASPGSQATPSSRAPAAATLLLLATFLIYLSSHLA